MNKDHFISDFSQELLEGKGCYFVGAGISVPSNLPDWTKLLEPFAKHLGVANLKKKDLPAIAQYIINENTGNRGPFLNSISKKLRKKYIPNKYHESISRTNVQTIWTTNYDTLLEDVFIGHIKDVKVNDDAISRNVPDAQVEIIKIHGCILNSPRNELVVTKADYEDFFINRPATAGRLKMDLVNKSFLFIGYGYGDPNIQNIILEARRLSNNATKQHYMVMMDERDAEFNLWCKDLKRYGINVVKIDDFLELEEILSDLSLKSRGNSVFITGSHNVKADADAFELGKKLANLKDIIFLDGQSTGIMRSAANAFMEKSIELKTEISKRLKIFPNPYAANSAFGNDLSFLPMLKQWRILLFKCAHVVVVFDGGMGTKAEVEVARYLGCLIIPFSKERNGLVNELMTYPDIIEKLNLISPHYVEKFNKDILIIEDVYETIVKAFKK